MATGSATGLSGRRILVVEDEFLIALDVQDALMELGCTVIGPAATAEQALQIIADTPPDAAVLDVRLANGDTSPIARSLHERRVPFVVLTGYERRQVADPVLHAAPILPKPLQRSALRRLLHDLLGS
jgi:CheY-like chemotaxis protein